MYSMKSRVRYSEADSGQKMTFQALTNFCRIVVYSSQRILELAWTI